MTDAELTRLNELYENMMAAAKEFNPRDSSAGDIDYEIFAEDVCEAWPAIYTALRTARAEALEEAAKVADPFIERDEHGVIRGAVSQAAVLIANAIRRLASDPPGGG